MKSLKKQIKGFTIIEVMIVLVIASIILLIVFLAVPALQRSSRNTQRKNDVAGLLAAVNEYASNKNGQLPSDQTDFNSNVLPNVNLGFYNKASEVKWGVSPTAEGNHIAPDLKEVYLVSGVSCNGNDGDAGTARQFAAFYNVETAAGLDQEQCQEG